MIRTILGIESTAHTLGIGIVKDGKIKANEKSMLFEYGIHPRKTADHHADQIQNVMRTALQKAKLRMDEIDLVAFSQGPGIGPCLRISAIAARTLAIAYKIPVVGVNHCVAHIEISKYFTKFRDPLILYVSGGNTQILIKENERYHVLGETLDVGIGNMLDTFARSAGLKSAKDVEDKAKKGNKYIEMPYSVKGMDASFSGILTHSEKLIGKEKIEDICYSLQETAYAALCEITERALALTDKSEIIVCGGVAQNKRLQGMLSEMAKEWKCKFGVAPNEFNADNGGMIAYVGYKMTENKEILKHYILKENEIVPKPKYRTDEFIAKWD
ncbi:MAG: KEOPS complex N(6)-L-threonylcarbamoyladenine synthase Kae1 [Candidatus Micrarchaeota archaeon]|nr:KEOPS complex N(6)-L-threonylcarbamoyladenine synthase Kae1 [Candidatus Micrarchaeota archaeon]